MVADLLYAPEQVASVTILPGQSTDIASKEIELNIVEPGWARIVLYGYNQTTVDNGVVARLNLLLAPGQSQQSLDLQIIAEASSRRVRDGRLASNRVENGVPTETAADQQLRVTAETGGTVVSNPAGINCGTQCSAAFALGESVTLTATAEPDYAFNGWIGACYGYGKCLVSMNQDLSVTANFIRTGPGTERFDLNVTKIGSGTVSSSPAGINCGTDCGESYDDGTSVILTAAPATGWTFTGWSGGACSGSNLCELDMTQALSVTANFSELSDGQQSLTVRTNGDGRVTSEPAGIDCGTQCSAAFVEGTRVKLTATPMTGAFFFGWSGACSESGNCDIEMSAERQVTATFSTAPKGCTHENSLNLGGQSIGTNRAFHACSSLTTGAGFSVSASGKAMLEAGERIQLGEGLRVMAGGQLTATINANLAADATPAP
jgi:hypothetical protein